MKKIFSKVLRIVLFVFFSMYAILLVATSLPYGYARLPKIAWLHDQKITQINDTIYVGTFPNEAMLRTLRAHGVRRIISLLDVRFPFVKDFGNYEKKLCKKLDIEYNNYSIFSLDDLTAFSEFLWMVRGKDKKVFIHGFFDSKRLHSVAKLLHNHAKQIRQTRDSRPDAGG